MTGTGISHGAITVINALPCGIGATIGVNLRTVARFEEIGNGKAVRISNDPLENDSMARICVSEACSKIGVEEPESWSLDMDSEIPISRGLKSSSSACNAIISAVLDHFDQELEDVDMIRLGVRCARVENVTVTGAFDDACGCWFGGFVKTRNADCTIISRRHMGPADMLIHVPTYKIHKRGILLKDFQAYSEESMRIVDMVDSDIHRAMTLNGSLISRIMSLDNSIADMAMESGALCAGISGTGPAVAMMFKEGEAEAFMMENGLKDCILTTVRDTEGTI